MTATPTTPSDADRLLLEAAAEASARAYVPYSNFRVGAAIRLSDGSIIDGCNVENASYGLTICAERTALVRLIAQGESPDAVEAIAVHVDGANGQPCGACRQFLAELIPAARISYIADGEPVTRTVIDLLPDAFVPGALAP